MPFPICLNDAFTPVISYLDQIRSQSDASAAALAVIHNDTIVCEWYKGAHHKKAGARLLDADSMFNIYSIRKSYVGLALAMAIYEGGIADMETRLSDIIQDIPREDLGELTVRHLATKRGPKFVGEQRLEREELINKVTQAATGLTIAQLLTGKVFEPLELTGTEWATSPKETMVCDFTARDGYASVRIESNEGHERNLYATVRDLACWGQLHLRKGNVRGKQVLPPELFDIAPEIAATSGTSKPVLGWTFENGYYHITGYTGCHIVVLPEYDAVGIRMLNDWNLPGTYHKDTYTSEIYSFHETLIASLEKARQYSVPSV
ncbi:serine hydrolase domain-containing protein [Paenibacillus sp. H1-7]|uniref:serine hydrolase domain-containing protein n=1 Tax=Paenibacillus sp. H1-7 TaxID=2282849 RepID=UPI001EF8655B|nr:serine hydrolase domain-containing protein [Paenibacillus sp. H1-7]